MENLRRAGYAQGRRRRAQRRRGRDRPQEGLRRLHQLSDQAAGDADRRRSRACSTRVFLRHVVEHVSDLDGFFAGVRTLLRDDGLLVLELPEVEESFTLGSPAILWEEHRQLLHAGPGRAPAEALRVSRSATGARYVFGGGSMAFVARKRAAPVACALSPPDPAPTIDLLRRFAGGIERQKAELKSLVSRAARRLDTRFSSMAPRRAPACSCRSAEIADMIDFVVDDRQDIQNRLMPGTSHVVRPLAEVAGAVGEQAAVPAGRRLGERVQGAGSRRRTPSPPTQSMSACSHRAIRCKASPRRARQSTLSQK